MHLTVVGCAGSVPAPFSGCSCYLVQAGHLTAGDAGRLAARSGTGLLVLTHLRPWQDHTQLLAEAAAIAPCPVVLAHPGLRISLMPYGAR